MPFDAPPPKGLALDAAVPMSRLYEKFILKYYRRDIPRIARGVLHRLGARRHTASDAQ